MEKIKKIVTSRFTKAKNFILEILVLASISQTALADTGDTITTVVYNLCDWLSGVTAIAVGVLVVIWSGYEMLHGDIDKKKMLIRCAAIGLIIGGSYYGKSVIMKGIS